MPKKPSIDTPSAAPGRRMEPGALIRRLIERITRTAPPADASQQSDQPPADLRPPGRRSGRGTDSIAAYLDQSRSTRPGPLE